MERKLFTAELQRLKAQKGDGDGSAVSNSEIMRMLTDIKSELHFIRHNGTAGDMAANASTGASVNLASHIVPPLPPDTGRHSQEEVNLLRTEMRALAVCIEQTKAEIAALSPTGTANDRLMVVTSELDAIVQATEGATESILEAAEKLDGLGRELRSCATEDGYITRIADEMGDVIVGIYEACNFQDITGQRISKVVRTLDFIEQRILAMIEIWGHEAIADILPEVTEEHASEEAKLLNGPQLSEHAITQDEIDKLFG